MTVLFTDGDFRLVKIEQEFRFLGSFIQHNHPELSGEALYSRTSFDWDGWVYCFGSDGTCTQCDVKVPKPMSGLMELENWDK